MTALFLRDTILSAVIQLLVQYSKTFDSSNDASFGKVRISDICKDLVSCGLLQGAGEAAYRR